MAHTSPWRMYAVLAACLSAGLVGASCEETPQAEILIRGGTVHPGDGSDGAVQDIAIASGRIVAIGKNLNVKAAKVIEANGQIVAPGFIDPHAHTDADLLSDDPGARASLSNLAQGVTTNIIGVDGHGPIATGELFAKLEANPPGVNVATYVGFGSIRKNVLGLENRVPDESQLAQMKAHVAKGMCEGALGFSTGLFYAPQNYAATEEVIELAKEAAARGGHYDSHQRDEGNGGPGSIGLVASVTELLRIVREAGLPGHFAHLKNSGVRSWGQSEAIIALVNTARAEGLQVTADQYPYLASGGSVTSILIPRWAQVGGREETLKRLADPTIAPKIKTEMTDFLAARGGGKNMLVIAKDSPLLGKTIADLAAEWKINEIEAAIRIHAEGDVGMAIFAIGEADLKAYLTQPWVMTGSDASAGHPRKFGTFPTVYAEYVVKEPLLTLPQFIHRSAGLAADTFGLSDRGYLREGYHADVVIFDPASYAPQSTYAEPTLPAAGVGYVLVNGQIAYESGATTGALAGSPLRHVPTAGAC